MKHIDIIQNARKKISEIDEKILELIKQREILASTIGDSKRILAIADKDKKREEEVLSKVINKAQELHLPIKLVTSLQQILMEISLIRQEQDRIKKSSLKPLSILIIGGSGRMGAWLHDFLVQASHKVFVFDKVKPLFKAEYVSDLSQAVKNKDIIIFATPIRITQDLLNKAEYFDKNTVIFDIASVKSPLEKALYDLKNQGYQVTSLHPLFGPSVEYLSGKHIICTTLGCQSADDIAKSLFSNTCLKIVDMSFAEHDKIMSYLLTFSHAINLIFGFCFKNAKFSMDFLNSFCSTTFYNQAMITQKVFAENPHLYFEIQKLNPYSQNIYQDIKSSMDLLFNTILHNKEDDFVSLIKDFKYD